MLQASEPVVKRLVGVGENVPGAHRSDLGSKKVPGPQSEAGSGHVWPTQSIVPASKVVPGPQNADADAQLATHAPPSSTVLAPQMVVPIEQVATHLPASSAVFAPQNDEG